MTDFLAEAEALFFYTQTLRRDFHMHPELGFQEVRTAGIVAGELRKLGLEVTTGIAETGVVGMLEGGRPGPVVLLRFDMDALPITEETGAEYASQNPEVMHACGHDAHTSIGLTVARLLHAHREELAGAVKFVFQPAEEGLGGARRMVAGGVLENPRPDLALALHIWNDRPLGWLSVTPGPAMAASDRFRAVITGSGGHGAAPHTTKDPVMAAAQVITALQSIVSRNVKPLEAAVVSVTAVNGGTAFNVIPSTVELKGTFRSYLPEVRVLLRRRIGEVVEGISLAMGCQAEVEFKEVTEAVINEAATTARVQEVARRVLPEAHLETSYQTMGSEDMADMMKDVAGCYFFVGSADAGRGLNAPHHHPRFDFDEGVLPRAAGLMASAAAEFLA